MRLSLKFFVVAMSLHGMILPNENIQSTSFSSYLRGAALFCAGMACMKGTLYLYQRYCAYKHQRQLNDTQCLDSTREIIEESSGSAKQENNTLPVATILFNNITAMNIQVSKRLTTQKNTDALENPTLLPPDVKSGLQMHQKDCVNQIECSYRGILSSINNIEKQYLIFSMPQSQRPTLVRRLSSIVGASHIWSKRASRTLSNIFVHNKDLANHEQAGD